MLLIVLVFFTAEALQLPDSLRDEVNKTVPEIISKYNYSVEEHQVITEDGYILTLHRILPKTQISKGSILVMHGIVASSADWIITGPQHALGYLLSNEGYDVWLGNTRGNRYSKNHTVLNPNSKTFWNFSWHEIGIYDLPAMIDYILLTTQEQKIFYIAHSQGTTIFYVLTTIKPSYNSKIRAQFSLAPVAFLKHLFSPIFRFLSTQEFLLQNIAEFINLQEILPRNGIISLLGQKFCGGNKISEILCKNSLFAICGFNQKQLNVTILPLILSHVPAGSSLKQVLHFGQEIQSGHFRQFDYGLWRNLKIYKKLKPPEYNLDKITTPIYIFYSKNDWISSSIDVNYLSKKIQSVKGKFLIADDSFNHLDYMFGIESINLVYKKIISLMTRH